MAVDGQLDLRSAGGTLSATENGNILDLGQGGTGSSGMVVVVRVPSATGTLAISCQFDDSSTMASVDHTASFPDITATGVYRIKVHTTRRYMRLAFTVTTGPFGVVEAYLLLGARSVGGARP